MESFKESISKRLDGHEDNFKNITDVTQIEYEVTQIEYKKCLNRLEDGRDPDKNDVIELQNVNNLYYLYFSYFNLFLFQL
jgi:hypothetical protein